MTSGRSRLARRVVLATLGLLLLVLAIAVTRALLVRSLQVPAQKAALIPVDANAAAGRLSRAIQFKTVSHQDRSQDDPAAFAAFHQFLREAFPRAHQVLSVETIEGRSLLMTWPGRDPNRAPVLLMAHSDVVPVDTGSESKWTHPPFGGVIAEGVIWGRGARDDKGSLMATLEAVEQLAAEGFSPGRTLLFFFGGDEEVLGSGAATLAATLAERNVHPELVLDEGLAITVGLAPGAKKPVAMIGISEKGFASLELLAKDAGGHSSMPPPTTASGRVARAAHLLETHPFPASLSGPAAQTLRYLAPEVGFGLRLVFTNPWLFSPILMSQFTAKHETNALVRTTTAVTQLEGSVKENVLPQSARAVVNFRLLPGTSVAALVERATEVIDDPGIEIRPLGVPSEPSPISPVDSDAFRLLQRTIGETFEDVLVAPGLVLGATDSRHLTAVSPAVYRFSPMPVTREVLKGIHGTDESIPVADYVRAIQFYAQLLRNAAP